MQIDKEKLDAITRLRITTESAKLLIKQLSLHNKIDGSSEEIKIAFYTLSGILNKNESFLMENTNK